MTKKIYNFHEYLLKDIVEICIILYLFHLIFKILFFFQVLYILTLKIIIDMHSPVTDVILPFAS